ncbi:Endonuclease/exonuclease/phosphatase [Trichophaea hybrida]|nr:Endonuclease/exonuclease/phosphatase [Trichophaea hybrida]
MAAAGVNGDVPVVNVFSMNCWGLKYIAKHRVARLNEISLRIARATPSHDIVALQEFWVYSDYLNLREKTRGVLPYGKFYFSGAIGGGLVILSKWPIEQSSMFRYPLNGRPTAVHRGDFYVGKGVACALIRHPSGRTIEIFNTHLHAPYEEQDTYLCHRTAQAWEIAKLLRGAVQKGSVVIGAGDFNMIPSSLGHRLISTHGLVSDSWLSANPNTPDIHPPGASAQYNIETMGATCDSVLNTWRMPGDTLPPPDTVDPYGKRLDYVFHSPTNSSIRAIKVGMTEPMDMPSQTGGKGGAGRNCTLSDHFSVEVQVALAPNYEQQQALAAAKNPSPIPTDSLVDIAGPARAHEAKLTQQVGEKEREKYLPLGIIDEIVVVQREYTAQEIDEKRWRIAHFFASLPVLIAIHVVVWWTQHAAIAFMLVFVSWLVAVTGVINGLIGFIFLGSELRALTEFAEEMTLYRQLAERAASQSKFGGQEAGKGTFSIAYDS